MPAHCINTLSLNNCDYFENVCDYLKGEDSDGKEVVIDFNKVIPMPDEIRNTTSPCPPNADLISKYGYSNWLDWSTANWGTKWNAYNIWINKWNKKDCSISFDTAWKPPDPVLIELSRHFSTIKFGHTYEIEHVGDLNNRVIINGVITSKDVSSENS